MMILGVIEPENKLKENIDYEKIDNAFFSNGYGF